MDSLSERLLSKQNIFFAIYTVNSWLQEPDLLDDNDRMLFHSLTDIYNEDNISTVIQDVQKQILKLLKKDDEFFQINVFFKPKGPKGEDTVFRPIHTAKLVDQIAMVAMLQVLVYEINSDGKLIPSELSRMLPSNFYGNRIAFDGAHLFKPWQEQYHQYTSDANERLILFAKTSQYCYEVNLDLENYFPSIDPIVIFSFLSQKFPMKWPTAERSIANTILRKLLFFKLNPLNSVELTWYCNQARQSLTTASLYAKGLPQGLPHTYFLANIFMLLVQEKYSTVFPGEMFFYVDDSVIFTNGWTEKTLTQSSFDSAIQKLNKEIRTAECKLREFCQKDSILPNDYSYTREFFGVTVHSSNGKSMYSKIDDAKNNSNEGYLRGLTRETSNIGFDIATIFSDEDVEVMYRRTHAISEFIQQSLDNLPEDDPNQEVNRKKLLRYKKFFSYRQTILNYRINGNISGLLEEILSKIRIRKNDPQLKLFWEHYNDDILAATIPFLLKRLPDDRQRKNLHDAVKSLCQVLYKGSLSHSYLWQITQRAIQFTCTKTQKYSSLLKAVEHRYCQATKQIWTLKLEHFQKLLENTPDYILLKFNFQKLIDWSRYIRNNSWEIERRILNATFSYLFEYEIDDNLIFAKRSYNPILYSELRILTALRLKDFSYDEFVRDFGKFTSKEYQYAADYSLLQVMNIFQTFVCNRVQIDQLILIHKYCSDTWKNGSKHLHFYTLHNQEHAVTLIQIAVRWIHTISYFNLKKNDYFILFAACYLHDISMVTLPDYSNFYANDNDNADQILSDVELQLKSKDNIKSKQALLESYQKIDAYFESNVRSNHASNSANEIRNFKELDFLDPYTREFIARISEAHGDNTENIYRLPSKGNTELINEKQLKILLRLSDLLDMACYRISDVILKHNLSKLNKVSRFHWISHLITAGCSLSAEYSTTGGVINSIGSGTKNGCITETTVLTVDVLMSQTTPMKKGAACSHVLKSQLYLEENNRTTIKVHCKKGHVCKNNQCSFLCKWFTLKNNYLLEELGELAAYLDKLPERFFHTEIEVRIRVVADTDIENDIFDYLKDYLNSN